MLERFTQVGEFYVMTCPDTVNVGFPGFMDILLYDEEKDRHVKIGFRRALMATGLFIDAGDPSAALTLTAECNNNTSPAIGSTIIGNGTKSLRTWAQNAALLENKSYTGTVPDAADKTASIVLARPFIEHAMLSAVIAVSGGDTGATVFGPSDMQISVRCTFELYPRTNPSV